MNSEQKLREIANNENGETLKKYVAEYWLDELDNYTDNRKKAVQDWYNDLMKGGCQNGMISSLIYYKDTHAFFDKYSNEIFELVDEFEDSLGEPMKIKDDRKNFYAWFGFEEMAREIAEEIGIEA